jgi:hypothetical protein
MEEHIGYTLHAYIHAEEEAGRRNRPGKAAGRKAAAE